MTKKLQRALGALLLTCCALAAVPAAQAEEAVTSGVVNINEAGADQLAFLPRVGPTVAARIIEHREANGPFASKEELMLVRGIGERTFEGLERFVATDGPTTLEAKVRLPKRPEPTDG